MEILFVPPSFFNRPSAMMKVHFKKIDLAIASTPAAPAHQKLYLIRFAYRVSGLSVICRKLALKNGHEFLRFFVSL
jgi:hypothetical protein